MKKKRFLAAIIVLTGICLPVFALQAASLGEKADFYVDPAYDVYGRSQLSAALKVIGEHIYFYVDDIYLQKLLNNQSSFIEELRKLAQEFDRVIYPKERAVFGSEWNPGIDNDSRITVLVSELVNEAGGYFNTYDGFPKSKFSASNEKEMVYLNALVISNDKSKAYLAHEFQHLITFYQKTILYDIEEEVWLNEARSEYAPTVCGYDDVYNKSYLAGRVEIFLENPSDSLTEWKNNTADYGVANLFLHFLVDHYGRNILTKMVLNNKIGIKSVEQALSDLGYSQTFSDVFNDWLIGLYLNDCQIEPQNKYCYLNKNLTPERLHIDYSASYSGFPNLIVSRSSSVKDWTPYWYRFRQGNVVPTERDTLKLEFNGSVYRGDFRVPYIVVDSDGKTVKVDNIPLTNQKGTIYIPEFTSQNKSVIIMPFNQYKKADFDSSESTTAFAFTASSVKINPLSIDGLSPTKGPISGGFEIIVKGNGLSSIKKVAFGQTNITDFNILDDQTISFQAPAQAAGSIDLSLIDDNGDNNVLTNAFTYLDINNYPEGSLLRAKNGYKVYVIKGNYKRWIQTAEIFNHYGHLKWENIIEVEPEELDVYQEAWLIRADGDEKVYQVDAKGTKKWLNMSGEQFSLSDRKWDSVFIINSFERDVYQTGSDILFTQ